VREGNAPVKKNWWDLRGKNMIEATEQWTGMLPQNFPREGIRRRMLDVVFNVGIPFNRWLGLKIKEFGPEKVVIESPATPLRRNHVGTAHACAQALIGEYASGLVVTQRFPMETYRIIIGKLEIEYERPGRDTLYATAEAPAEWTELKDEEGWVDMVTKITNEANESVSVCRTRWQVKSWRRIEADRAAR
jgi:acyl-coenzyme A thioesterase PaaI-like protein